VGLLEFRLARGDGDRHAPFRYPHYHTLRDTPDKLDYDGLARVVLGLERVVRDLLVAAPQD